VLVEHTKNYEKQKESSPLVKHTKKHEQKVFSSLKEYDSSDIKRIVHEHLNSISIIDAQGNVLIVFMAVPVANFVGESVQEMNKNGIYSWSPALKAIETGSPVLGTVKSKFGNEQMVACTPLMDENGKVVMAVDVALDKKLVDKYFEGIKDGEETCGLY
jgi:transcriptional regulator with PAS, ATPase and Fis domain